MKNSNYHHAAFLLSAAMLDQLPVDKGIEVAFIGRSNAGKSSALNTVTGIKGLAHTSKTPGRTQTINLYRLNDSRRLVDLPGYGYAKVPLSVKWRWQETINHYLQMRQCLKGLVLVMDIRHPLKESDWQLIQWAMEFAVPLHVLLTKCDKLSQGLASTVLREVQQQLSEVPHVITVQLFSSLDHTGLGQILVKMDEWFEL